MGKLLWQPSKEVIEKANITRYVDFVNERYGLKIDPYAPRSYFKLYEWSVANIPEFWESVWDFVSIKASCGFSQVVDDLNRFPGAKWFVGAKLNFAENLLRYRDDHIAIISVKEDGVTRKVSYNELYDYVARLAASLRKLDVSAGDRVCAYMPNLLETPIALLAATSVGAVWSSCGSELGTQAVIDRLGQLEPKVLFTTDGYIYKGKYFDILEKVKKVAEAIPSLRKVIVVSYAQEKPDISNIPNSVYFDEFLSSKTSLTFEQVPSDHPLYIMFSSGTTGKPKCMVQGCAGVLVNHLKELIIHTDLKREDKILYITSPSWMMWNWLISSLAVGATVVLYDGNPNHPNWDRMWQIIQDWKVTIFGCSATYIEYLKSVDAKPGKLYDLSSLREISQTGSPLSADGFEWVYKAVKEDLHFNSISGGTDINGCFAIGNPTLPVYAGELQAPGLGMKIKAYNMNGEPIWDAQGELVCEAPAPSMPLYFWNDPKNERYLDAYFRFFPNKNVWRHGDFVIFHSDTGGITFLGRSDAVLKPSGVRIGTAEIYNIVEKIPGIADSLAVGQNWKGDQRIILFVKLSPGYTLTEELKNKIRKALRENASPRHAPALILEAPDIPYTFNMKKVEVAVTNIINGKPVVNRDSIINPESLDYFEKILPQLQVDA